MSRRFKEIFISFNSEGVCIEPPFGLSKLEIELFRWAPKEVKLLDGIYKQKEDLAYLGDISSMPIRSLVYI